MQNNPHGIDGPANGILIASGYWAPEPWAEAVRALDPGRDVHIWPDLPDPDSVGYLMAWQPPPAALRALPNLKAIFSLGAGVEHIVFVDGLPDVPVARIVSDDLTRRMTEWVVLQVLLHHRQQLAYLRLQTERRWRELRQPAASGVRVGLMGLGVLGAAAADPLVRLGFQVAGWSRMPKTLPGVTGYAGDRDLDAFLGRTDILVCLLPLTDETRGILSAGLFGKLARDGALGAPIVINAGRGGLQVEADIVDAIESGVLAGASLDVFETEPLDPASPLWGLEGVVITPHVAAYSDPAKLVGQIVDQIARLRGGQATEEPHRPFGGLLGARLVDPAYSSDQFEPSLDPSARQEPSDEKHNLRLLPVWRGQVRDFRRFRTILPVPLRALSKKHGIGTRGQPVFIDGEDRLAVRPGQDQDISGSRDATQEKLLLRMRLRASPA